MPPDDRIAVILAGYDNGRTLEEIGKTVGLSASRVSSLAKEAGVVAKRDRLPRVSLPVKSTTTPAAMLAWRKNYGFTQTDACNLLGISRRTLQHAEGGTTRMGLRVPKIPRLIELALKGLNAEIQEAEDMAADRDGRAEVDGKSRLCGIRGDPGYVDADPATGVAEVARS